MARLFLPKNEGLVDFKQVSIGEKAQKVQTLHPMVGLNVDWPLCPELNVRHTASLAGLQRNCEQFFPRHARLKDPYLRGLEMGRRLLNRTHRYQSVSVNARKREL
jgi:hypothetical protein